MIPRRYGVYFFLGGGGSLVKIGKAFNVRVRFAQVRGANAGPVEYLADIRGYTRVEKLIHHRFAHLRDHCEWFRYEDELPSFVEMARDNWNLSTELFPDAVHVDETYRKRELINREAFVAPVPIADVETARAKHWREHNLRINRARRQAALNGAETRRRRSSAASA